MLSKLEKAIAAKILPISIDYCGEVFLSVDIIDEGYWVGYENDGSEEIGLERHKASDYSKTLDEAVEKLIPIVWEVLSQMEDEEECKSYLEYCLDLEYDVLCRDDRYSIPDLPECPASDSEDGLMKNKRRYIELCARNKPPIPFPLPRIGGNFVTPEEIQKARKEGDRESKSKPKAIAAWYELLKIYVELENGVILGIPYALLQGLESATTEQLKQVKITASGYGISWETLDADLSVPQLFAGVFGSKSWMAELGRLGGSSKSASKQKSSKKNGKKGGRPKKT